MQTTERYLIIILSVLFENFNKSANSKDVDHDSKLFLHPNGNPKNDLGKIKEQNSQLELAESRGKNLGLNPNKNRFYLILLYVNINFNQF